MKSILSFSSDGRGHLRQGLAAVYNIPMPISSEILANPRSQRIRHIADLARAKNRKKYGRFLVEGPQGVREAIGCKPGQVLDLYCDQDFLQFQESQADSVVGDLAYKADDRGIHVHVCSAEVMDAISKDCQGIAAVVRKGAVDDQPPTGDGFRQSSSDDGDHGKARSKDENKGIGNGKGIGKDKGENRSKNRGFYAACWQLRDPGNAGTIIRLADAAGLDGVILVDDCVDETNPKVVRSTAGSLFHLPIIRMGIDDFFAFAQEHGATVVAADAYGTDQVPVKELPAFLDEWRRTGQDQEKSGSAPTIVLFGNEARGLDDPLINRCQEAVRIPLYGKAESLNVAMSAAVILYSLAMAD